MFDDVKYETVTANSDFQVRELLNEYGHATHYGILKGTCARARVGTSSSLFRALPPCCLTADSLRCVSQRAAKPRAPLSAPFNLSIEGGAEA